MKKITENHPITLQREGDMVSRTHWVAGLVPHPNRAGKNKPTLIRKPAILSEHNSRSKINPREKDA
ncbi:hypothetical protein LPTSP3_g07650 [Leptospira kobayashii]|uniref:Uncharacterized protein n=1 Tax=Leptospira kobayashii TaxID=1917830 RepID=A0ABM7URI0_9LEPT|nr:hypothetical protein [Leptospira kobayashii]BDA77835.1 hypothetical protein LPTSP3_g07650 [Leptospira kobayashii]